ncbi:MAG: hypothetical protein NTX00_05310 [Candidatus Parcubacteria bacterium]|nr:hypothetical protein [Candidatus Parcubacteria bacterium]
MNLKPKKPGKWSDCLHKKIIAVYVALAVVLLVNQIVFSFLLKDREKAKAFSNTFMANLFTTFAGGSAQAGSNNFPAAQFIVWGAWITDNPGQTCSYRLDDPGNTCLTPVDFDGSATAGPGVQADGAKIATFDWFPAGGNLAGIFFNGGDKLCTDSLTAPACVYVDSDGDCNGGTGTQTYILGGACAGGADTAVSGLTTPLWLHSELINNNGAYDDGEAIWIYNLKPDTVITGAEGSYWNSAYPNQWQGDAPGAWIAKDTFFDANTDNKFDGSPNEPVYIDSDGDGLYTDSSNITYATTENSGVGSGLDDDNIPDGTTLRPLIPADNVCINTLGQDSVGDVIIYVDGGSNVPPGPLGPPDCIPGNGGTDVLIRDDTATGLGVGPQIGVFPHAYVSAALILYYYDADSSLTWTHGATAGLTETLWARLQGLKQWHSNIEGATGPIEADGTATLGAGADDDALVNGASLTYLQTADNVCFSRHPITTALEDIYIDISGDCIPGNGGPDTILQDTTGDGLNPATSNGGWASGAGTLAYFDGAVGAPNLVWDWGAGAAATETLWLEIHGNKAASSGDANVYGYGSALAGDTLTALSGATGPNGFNLIYANADSTNTLTSANTILEDEGNVQTGAQNNGVIDRQADILQHITIKNTGTAVAGSDITSVDLFDGGAAGGGCDNPVGSVNDTFLAHLTATGPNTWEYTGAVGPGGSNGRICISVNINPFATVGRTITLRIPQLVDTGATAGLFDPGSGEAGIFYYSGNDGPTGGNVDLPYTFTITALPSYNSPAADNNAPAIVTDVKITADSSGKVTITWKDPTDSDLAKIVIDETLNGQTNTNTIDKGIQQLVLTGRQINQTYTYKIRSEDSNGNLSPAVVFNITIPAQGAVEVTQPSGIVPTPIMPEVVLPNGVSIGDLLKDAASKTVYAVGNEGKRHVFPNAATFFTWFKDFSMIKTVSDNILSQLPMDSNVTVRPGTKLVKIQTDPNVYTVEPGGIIRAIKSEAIARELYGTDWAKKVLDVPDSFFVNYVKGSDITAANYPTGSLIKYQGSSEIYYIDNLLKKLVTAEVFVNNLFRDEFVIKNVAGAKVYPLGDNLLKSSIIDMMMLK